MTLFGLFDSLRAGMGLYVREGVEKLGISIKPKFYKLGL